MLFGRKYNSRKSRARQLNIPVLQQKPKGYLMLSTIGQKKFTKCTLLRREYFENLK